MPWDATRFSAFIALALLGSSSTTSTEDAWNALSMASGKGYMSCDAKWTEPVR